jgi:hypothetical protein
VRYVVPPIDRAGLRSGVEKALGDFLAGRGVLQSHAAGVLAELATAATSRTD